jgi:hypothetical protein
MGIHLTASVVRDFGQPTKRALRFSRLMRQGEAKHRLCGEGFRLVQEHLCFVVKRRASPPHRWYAQRPAANSRLHGMSKLPRRELQAAMEVSPTRLMLTLAYGVLMAEQGIKSHIYRDCLNDSRLFFSSAHKYFMYVATCLRARFLLLPLAVLFSGF